MDAPARSLYPRDRLEWEAIGALVCARATLMAASLQCAEAFGGEVLDTLEQVRTDLDYAIRVARGET